MFSVEDLKNYCRSCFDKLNGCSKYNTNNAIPIHKFPDLENLIQSCLSNASANGDCLCPYAPFLCRSCFEKWKDFSRLYQQAIKSEEKIRSVLRQSQHLDVCLPQITLNENANECFLNSPIGETVNEVEKYETVFPFFTSNLINNHKDVPGSDPTRIKSQDSANIFTEQDDDITSCYSDKSNGLNSTSEPKEIKRFNIKKFRKNKSSRKSLGVLKKIYKTRNTIRQIVPNSSNDEINDNERKRIRYQCEQCNKYFWEKNKYEGHMKQVHEGIRRPFKCLECDKAYNLYKTLLQHKRECHSEKSKDLFKCGKCNKTFKTGVILKQHLNNKHSDRKESIRSICDQCGFIAAHQYSLSRHIINKHTETDQIKCDQCPKVFKTQYSLKYHVLGHHNPSNIKPFKCSECQMGFTRKTLLNQHKRTHLKYTERIKCDFEGCDVRFVKHGDKTHHMRLVHLKVKQHICDFCGEAFGAMQTLRHHRFIHTGEKPYKCNVCGQGFRQHTAMKTHRKTHLGKKIELQDAIANKAEANFNITNNLNS